MSSHRTGKVTPVESSWCGCDGKAILQLLLFPVLGHCVQHTSWWSGDGHRIRAGSGDQVFLKGHWEGFPHQVSACSGCFVFWRFGIHTAVDESCQRAAVQKCRGDDYAGLLWTRSLVGPVRRTAMLVQPSPHSLCGQHTWSAQGHPGGAGFTLRPCLDVCCPFPHSPWLPLHMLMRISYNHVVREVLNPIQSTIWNVKKTATPPRHPGDQSYWLDTLELLTRPDTRDVQPFSAEPTGTQIHHGGPSFESRIWPGSH